MRKLNTMAGWCGGALLAGWVAGAGPTTTTAPAAAPATQPVSIDADGRTGAAPGEGDPEQHVYRLHVGEHGVYRLRFTRPRLKNGAVLGELAVEPPDDRPPYEYHVRDTTADDLFFPVLDAGDYVVRFTVSDQSAAKAAFHLKMERLTPRVTDADRAAATAAIERGLTFLTSVPPDQAQSSQPAGVEGLVMMALTSDRATPERRRLVEEAYVPFLLSQFQSSGDVKAWNGHPVNGVLDGSRYGYEQPIATLALAEAASSMNSAAARRALSGAVEALLAGQNGPRKCKEWQGPVDPESRYFGGWRYEVETLDADVSVTGWCAIALAAAATATPDAPMDGLRDGLANAATFVHHMGQGDGYSYNPGGPATGDVRRGIGVLVSLLLGDDGGEVSAAAAREMDRHLAPGTQVDAGEDYPLYYAYYATRANYLRGGFEWEAWRATMIEQLLHLQQKDGSWPCFGSDGEGGPRYATALATMILRMCLNDVPAYLKQEVRGF